MGGIEGPFLGSEALAMGLVTRRRLQNEYRSIYRDVYLAPEQLLTPSVKATAAWLWSGRNAAAAGLSAAALFGSRWIDSDRPAELNRRNGKAVDGIVIHRDELWADEITTTNGIATTSPERTAFDLGRRNGVMTAVIRLDALAQATGLRRPDVDALVDRHRGVRGVVQLRRAMELFDSGAESPQETRTRLLLVRAGLPKPRTQIVVRNESGCFIARVDMGWDDWLVGVEFDGAQHWTDPVQRTRDIDRLAELQELGWRIIRVSSDLLRQRPEVIIERVCAALRAGGCSDAALPEWPIGTRPRLGRAS